MRDRILRFLPKESRFPIGENITWDHPAAITPERVVAKWMASPEHRSNILRPQFRRIGVGFIKGSATPAVCVQTFSG